MFRRMAIPLIAGIAVVLWLALADTPAFAQHGHGVSHHGFYGDHATFHGAVHPHAFYGQGTYAYPSYNYAPYYGYGSYRYGVYGGTTSYRPYAYSDRGYRPPVRRGFRCR